jgi:hypothetical protein
MRIKFLAVMCWVVIFCGIAAAFQRDANYYPFKDLVFAQVAAGGGYESLITVTNRGTQSYAGTIQFYRRDPAQQNNVGTAWNPTVNSTPVAGGLYPVTIPAGATASFLITVSGATEAGFAIIKATNLDLTNFLEGSLTYYVKSGTTINDAIGVLPSSQIIGATIPFEDFSSVALAFANTDGEGRTAAVKLTLYSENNVQVSNPQTRNLFRLGHDAIYLSQIFPGVQLRRGRVEIESDIYVSATALTQAPGLQFSAIPMGSTSATYSVFTSGVGVMMLRMTLWTNGIFANGYLMLSQSGGAPQMLLVSGQTLGGVLRLHFYGENAATQNYELFGYITSDAPISVGAANIRGTYYVAIYSENYVGTGTFNATLIK